MALLQGFIPLTAVRRGSALLSVPLVAVIVLFAAACGGEAETGAEVGSGDVAGNTSPGAPITITTYLSPT